MIFYAAKGDNTITEIHRKSGCTQVFVRSTIKGYLEKGIDYIYECSRGIKKSVLDSIETELLAEFEKNPPSSIPEAVSQIKEKFGITLTKLRSDIGLEKGALLPQIPGAVRFSRVWLIPKDAKKLIDGRCKRLS